jgi:hypothetical protein
MVSNTRSQHALNPQITIDLRIWKAKVERMGKLLANEFYAVHIPTRKILVRVNAG